MTERGGARGRPLDDAGVRRPGPGAPVIEGFRENAIAADADVNAHPAVTRRGIGSIDLECGLDNPDVGFVRLDSLDGGSTSAGLDMLRDDGIEVRRTRAAGSQAETGRQDSEHWHLEYPLTKAAQWAGCASARNGYSRALERRGPGRSLRSNHPVLGAARPRA